MSRATKILYQFPLLLAISLLVSYCSVPKTEAMDEQSNPKNEIELDSLISQITNIKAKEDPNAFINLYIETTSVLDLLPDNSELKNKARWRLIDKLSDAGALQEAIKHAKKYIHYNATKNDTEKFYRGFIVYGKLAGLYNSMGDVDSTQISYSKAIQQAKYYPVTLYVTAALNNMGMFFQNQENYDSAMFYYTLANNMLERAPTKSMFWTKFHGSVKDNIASTYEELGEFEKAKPLYKENFSMYQMTGDLFRWMNAGISLANTEFELGNYQRVDTLLDKLSLTMDSLDYPNKSTNQLDLLDVRVKINKHLKRYQKALEYQHKISIISDSINSNEKNIRDVVSAQLARFTSERFNYQIQIEKAKSEKEAQKGRMRSWIIILITLGSLTTLTISFFYYKQRIQLHTIESKRHHTSRLLAEEKLITEEQEKKLIELDLENKKRDVADMAINLSMKQNWASELSQKLALIDSSRGNKRSREFKKLKTEIKNQVYIDKQLNLLNQNIDTLNAAFYKKLKDQFPVLTKTDIKLCSYIKINLSNLQVAQLQNIDPASVKVSRHRLKKKLKLDLDQNLDEFIQNF